MNSLCLERFRAHSILFNSLNGGKLFLELNSEGLYQSSGKEKKKVVVLCPRPRQNVKLGTFTLWSCNKVQNSCCFANLNLLLFCLSRCRRRRCCLTGFSSLMMIAFVFRFCRYQKKSVKVIKICKGTGRGGGGGGEEGHPAVSHSHFQEFLQKYRISPFFPCFSKSPWLFPKKQCFNPFAPGNFAEKRVLKLVEWFSGHCRAIRS